ncbi:MAG: hypothetical protein HOI72_06440 [Candidatus Marinimicrobia bacterium]|jgi:hypothetical protein|nr:hypothetical protein [Candidatus Neomarinimicrobiota bacterium]MBT5224177.1 hypothetical protein [Candidatus Neomarinimicrobiota bacterium]MBT5721813.1 hypothetical protein [Candidatus Neomarinimicrobiota bacterium]MBT6517011.1 hypothetical protein [Candidatus Neomarinimicrobiota bacterium]MBT6711015.1 hypothetical protein [Candidatus Neomarinimicrobiota bacterium]
MNKTNTEIKTNKAYSRDRVSTAKVAYWGLAWLLATAGATFGPELLWGYGTLITSIGIAIQLALGFGMIWAFKGVLLAMDELQRLIQLEAISLALGVGVVVGVSYELLEDIKLITFQPEISHLIILITLTYSFGLFLGNRHYR